MALVRKLAMVGGTAACALGIGYFVQMGETVPERPETVARAETVVLPQPAPIRDLELSTRPADMQPTEALNTPEIAPTAEPVEIVFEPGFEPGEKRAESAESPVIIAALDAETPLVSAPEVLQPAAEADSCEVSVTTETLAGAMVGLDLTAPCAPNARVTIHHNGLMFTQGTDAFGGLNIEIPALAVNAVFVVELDGGAGAVAVADVPSLVFYDRVALQWADKAGFEIHALEFGAEYGQSGHVWMGEPRDVTAAALGDGGFVSLLGDGGLSAPRLAQVYTFPSATASKDGTVALSIEAEVTDVNCGRTIAAQSLELRDGASLRTRDLSLAMPGCDATGTFLVLNNLVNDLKIAAR